MTEIDCESCQKSYSSTVPQCPACGAGNREHPAVKAAIAKQGPLPERISKMLTPREKIVFVDKGVPAVDVASVMKSAADARAAAIAKRDEKLAELRKRRDELAADFAKEHNISEGEAIIAFPSVRTLTEEIATLASTPIVTTDPAEQIAKSATAAIDAEIRKLEARKLDLADTFAVTHGLSTAEAEAKIAKQVWSDAAAGREHWLTRIDREIDELRIKRGMVVAEAQQRVYEVRERELAPIRAEAARTAAERVELEEAANALSPVETALEKYVAKFAAEHEVAREVAIARLVVAKDDVFLALRAAAEIAPLSPSTIAARKRLAELDAEPSRVDRLVAEILA